jgi:hypothetical protein
LIPLGVILELLILKTNQLLFFRDFIGLVAFVAVSGALVNEI